MINKSSTPKRGLFVVLEGIDGSGTTTQVKLVSESLSRRNYSVHCTREPSDGPIGRLIRCVLSGQIELDRGDDTMALLFAADRMDHLKREVQPALDRGLIVLCDRYYYSSMAYQSSDERSEMFTRTVNGKARPPDLTIVLEVGLEEAQRRLNSRARKDYTEAIQIQKKVHAWYNGIRNKFTHLILTLDGAAEPIGISSQICLAIERTLNGEL